MGDVAFNRLYQTARGIWQLEYARDGQLCHFSLRTRDDEKARAKADQWRRDLIGYNAFREKERRMADTPEETVTQADPNPDFKELCLRTREYLIQAESMLQALRKQAQLEVFAEWLAADVTGEMVANVVLAFRHLEDCRMRLGKAVQAFDGGKSVYPR